MKKFIKYYTMFVCIYIAICTFAVFSFAFLSDYGKAKYNEQIYYLDSCDYNAFLSKYKELYLSRSVDSLDYFSYTPYTLKTGEHVIKTEKYVERQCDSAVVCNYYLNSIDGWVSFVVKKNNPLELTLQMYCPSIEKRQEKQWKYKWAYGIYSMSLPYSDIEEILDGFEQSFLAEFGSYRRDHLQEWEKKYTLLLEKIFIGDGLNLLIFMGVSALLIGGLFLHYAIIFIRDLIIPVRIKGL